MRCRWFTSVRIVLLLNHGTANIVPWHVNGKLKIALVKRNL